MADVGKRDRRRPAGNPVHPVVLSDPEPPVARRLGRAGQTGGTGQGFGHGPAFTDGDQVKDGERYHRPDGAGSGPNWSR